MDSLNKKEKRELMISKANERLGETNLNKLGSKMWIIRYGNANDIDVEFENGYVVKNTQYASFINGVMKNPYDKSVYGHGYTGEGVYKISTNGVHTKEYIAWKSMLTRCYSLKYQAVNPTYKDCSVCDEWLNFQKFAEWYSENYYEFNEERMELDKDILVKGNKIYSPYNCIFVPFNINRLFTKTQVNRGLNPIGVYYKNEKYYAFCNDGKKKQISLGSYNAREEAFNAYKSYKENLIKYFAEEYKNEIPERLYNALIRYVVSIND